MPDTLLEIIKEKNKRLVSIPNKFYSSVQKTEVDIYAKLLGLLERLKTDAKGQIIRSKANLLIADEINVELKKVLYSSDYIKAVASFAKQFDSQKVINDKYFSKAFPEFTASEIADTLVQYSKKQAVTLLTGSSIDDKFFQPINQAITDAVDTGASRVDLIQAIRDVAIGDPEREGKLLSYSKQIAHDAFALADRSYTNAIADEFQVEWFFYSGDQIPTSRDFCIARHNKYYHYKEIQAWGQGKDIGVAINPKTGLWEGAMKGTNKATIFKTAGGYNCQHSIMPVSISVVPKSVIERNREAGYYNKKEKF